MMTISVKINPEKPAERMRLFEEFFGKELQVLHNACCFFILEQCIQWTRVDTGRLRSGWIPFLVAKNHDYLRSLGPVRDPQEGAIEEGMDAGRFQEAYLSLYVENGVNYAGYVDSSLTGDNGGMFDVSGAHSFRPAPVNTFVSAVPLFAERYAQNMDKLFQNCDEQLDKLMKGASPEDIDVPTDLGPPDYN